MLTRHLQISGIEVVEVNQPDRATRRRVGKSDPIDAEAARSGSALRPGRRHTEGHGTCQVDALRNLRVARRDAVKHQGDTARRMKSLLITAPDQIRDQLTGLTMLQLARKAAAFRPDVTAAATGEVAAAIKVALASLARSWLQARVEIRTIAARHDTTDQAPRPAPASDDR